MKKGCDYQGYEFGASYKDSVCIGGYLFDADAVDNEGSFYSPSEDEVKIPCPKCNSEEHEKYLEEEKEEMEGS